MKFLKNVEKNLELYIMCVLLASLTIVMFMQVILRYVFKSSLQWPDEFCRYCFVTIVWFGCSYCIRHRTNLRIDSVLNALPPKAGYWVDLLVDVITFAFYVLMTNATWAVTLATKKMKSDTPSLEIPQYMLYGLMFVGFLLATIRCLEIVVIKFVEKKRKSTNNSEQREERE